MRPTKCNGPDAPHDRPAKTLTKRTADFIARAASFATADSGGYLVLCVVVLLQAVLIALPPEFLSGLDWVWLVALGGITRTPEQIPLFEGPAFCPLMPPRGSDAERALNDLLVRDLTQPDWLNEGKGWRLAAAVKELGYLGWEPISVRVKWKGCKRPIAKYSLSQEAKRAAYAMRNGSDHASE